MEWRPDAKHGWGAYPLMPIANDVVDQTFLWDRGQRSSSNIDLNFSGQPGPFAKANYQMPTECSFQLPGCQVPPLAVCREGMDALRRH